MHEIGIMSCIGLTPSWMRDHCSITGKNRVFNWMYETCNLGEPMNLKWFHL